MKFIAHSQPHFKSSNRKMNGLAKPSNQQLWWLLESQFLITVKYAMLLMVVTFNTCTRFANSISASVHAQNGPIY